MLALPQARLVELEELGLVGHELLRVKLAAPVLHADVVHLVQHLVEHDPRDEEARHERAIERAVDPDQAILDGVAAHLDRVAALRAARARAPRDRGIDLVAEVLRVELVEDRAQIVVLAGREDELRRLAPRAAATAHVDRVLIDEVAEHARRVRVVLADVARERARDHRVRIREHVMQADVVACLGRRARDLGRRRLLRVPAHRVHRVAVVGQRDLNAALGEMRLDAALERILRVEDLGGRVGALLHLAECLGELRRALRVRSHARVHAVLPDIVETGETTARVRLCMSRQRFAQRQLLLLKHIRNYWGKSRTKPVRTPAWRPLSSRLTHQRPDRKMLSRPP